MCKYAYANDKRRQRCRRHRCAVVVGLETITALPGYLINRARAVYRDGPDRIILLNDGPFPPTH